MATGGIGVGGGETGPEEAVLTGGFFLLLPMRISHRAAELQQASGGRWHTWRSGLRS